MLTKINRRSLFLTLLLLLTATLSFGLGRLSKIEEGRVPIRIDENQEKEVEKVGEVKVEGLKTDDRSSGRVVASKTGEKYHYPWCSGAQRIKEENKIWFASPTEARKAGYTPAANCQGLE